MTELLTDTLPTPIGELRVWTTTERAVCFTEFTDHAERAESLLRRRFKAWQEHPAPLAASARLRAYFDGELDALDTLAVSTGGTPFQARLWAELRSIPSGETLSYGKLAAQLGRPLAARAIGAACGLNPIAIVLPCHRVVGASGALTGYAGGMERKHWLLEHERARRGAVPQLTPARQDAEGDPRPPSPQTTTRKERHVRTAQPRSAAHARTHARG